MHPLQYPAVPDYYQVPSDLEHAYQEAMEARRTAEEHLRALTSVVDLTTENVRAQLLAQVALDCAKIASSLAVCEISDWLEEAEEPPAYRWRAASRVSQRRPKRRTVPPGEVQG